MQSKTYWAGWNKKNLLTIYKSTDETVDIKNSNVEIEDVKLFHIFRIKNKLKSDATSPIDLILKELKTHCREAEKKIIENLMQEFHDAFNVKVGLTFGKDGEHKMFA